jgi:hypothetical protein
MREAVGDVHGGDRWLKSRERYYILMHWGLKVIPGSEHALAGIPLSLGELIVVEYADVNRIA